jgi:hypothetical protein
MTWTIEVAYLPGAEIFLSVTAYPVGTGYTSFTAKTAAASSLFVIHLLSSWRVRGDTPPLFSTLLERVNLNLSVSDNVPFAHLCYDNM